MAIINTPLLGLPYAGADTDETYAVLAGLFVKDGKKLTLPEIVEKYTPTVGTVHIKAADWTAADGTEDAYDAKIKINGVEAESVILIYPLSSADTEKAKRLGIRAKTLSGSANDDTFVIVRATGGAPTVADNISLVYIAFRGYPVWNEGITPPAMPYATVIGVDPYIATEEGDRDDIAASQRLVTSVAGAIRKSVDDLAKTAIDKSVTDLVNYYNKSQTLTKDEINALVSAIPKFKIEVVTSLPTSNISDTTVYLVKSGDDDSNLYTEYIRTGGKWEKLGTQTVGLTGYATEAWVNDILASYVKTADMEAYVAGLLKAYITKDVADETYQPAGNYPTNDEMDTAISKATQNLAPKSSIPAKVSQLSNDSGYLTPTTGDQRYAKPSDIPTVPMSVYDFAVEGGYTGSEDDLKKQLAIEIKFDNGNLFNKAEATDGYYLASSGVLRPDSNCAVSGYIPVKPNTTYTRSAGATVYTGIEYDSSQGVLNTLPATKTFTTSANTFFIRCTLYTAQTPIDTYMVVEGDTLPSGYVPYGPSLRIAGQKVSLDTSNSNMPLFGKLGVIGDSLSNQEKWQTIACAVANITEWHKNAITGSCLADYGNATYTPFVNRYLDTPEDCDCITIMGGTNDANTKYGEEEYMGEVGVLSNGTFRGAYSTIIEGLLARKPSVRILLITPPRSYTVNNTLNEHVKPYADATKEVAEYYGLPCLDLYNTLGINDKTFTYMLYDNVHFSDEGGLRVGRMIGNFIKTYY